MGAVSRAPFEVARLQAERLETTEKIEHLQAEMHNLAEPSADEADVDAYEREKLWALTQTLQQKLESIDKAIQLAQTGGYGICQSCGTDIDPARLDILPHATLCLKCQRAFERHNRRARP
jgi:DnaK suppressor protein